MIGSLLILVIPDAALICLTFLGSEEFGHFFEFLVAITLGVMMHHRGWPRAGFEIFHLADENCLVHPCQNRRAPDTVTVCAVAGGTGRGQITRMRIGRRMGDCER